MTRLDVALTGAGGALLGLGGAFCVMGETGWGGLVFAAGLLLSLHVAANWRQP